MINKHEIQNVSTYLILILIFFSFLFSCRVKQKIVLKLNPAQNNHIVFLGNTFAERLQHYNYFETFLYKSFPTKNLTVRNLGWSADEINLQPRPLNFGTVDEHLSQQKADIIFACFGLNEAYKGPDSLESFKYQLSVYLKHLQKQHYNGKSAPLIILISPITHEKMGEFMPDPVAQNKNLELYTQGMGEVAKSLNVPFIDLFGPTGKSMDGTDSLTINGIHLNDKGYKAVSEMMAQALDLPVKHWKQQADLVNLKQVIDHKNQQYFYKFRAVNGEYINGRRKEPWVQPAGGLISYPTEFKKLDQMILNLDSLVWAESKGDAKGNLEKVQKIINDTLQFEPYDTKHALNVPSTDQFILPEGYEINLFASEVDFPIGNPVKITFDPKGRLWVASMPSYPQYLPGSVPNDKIVILEDTNGDGKADKHTVFADSLYMPLGFELGDGGVYVTEAPDLLFLKDTNGDGKADSKKILLHGFGTEDVHHSISAQTWGPDGALYWHMGTFLHTQVETPYGPKRGAYGTTWRFEPRTQKLEPYVTYPYANPWGNVFTRNGTHLIGDVSTGMNYFAPPLTVASDFPIKHTEMKDFLTSAIKPKTCGMEVISSSQFPDDVQGDVLFNTFIGFQGIKQHHITEEGSGIVGKEVAPLLQSKDPDFRPVDLQFGPDGALYVVDWYNPIINHGERALRDPHRDHTHGRIWRITYKNKKILTPVDLTSLKIDQLLDQLKVYEDRVRYRTRMQLREIPENEVLPALAQWITKLDRNDKNFEQNRLEGLWVYQQFNRPNEELLNEVLKSKDEHVRAAATRVLFYWNDQVKDAQNRLISMSRDPSQRVRLEAIASLSHFDTEAVVNALLETTTLPVDYYIDYALKESFKELQPVWMAMFKKDKNFLANEPKKAAYLLQPLSSAKLLDVPGFIKDDPQWQKYARLPLSQQNYNDLKDVSAVSQFLKSQTELPADDKTAAASDPGRTVVNLTAVPAKMLFNKGLITVKAGSQVSLVFENADQMAHNVVIAKPGTLEKVGHAAEAMASQKDGYEKNFVPEIPEVLFATPLINGGKTFKLDFTAPTVPGEYPFLCSFPGHWQMMKGILKVVKP
ncbi:MAG: PVC-type heme-binding CxxCH protein [Sphingobacteriaceae bacterium]